MTRNTLHTALTAALVGLLLVGWALFAALTAHATKPNPDHKVTLCHRTGSESGGNTSEGYTIVTVDIASSGYVKGGHDGHEQVGNGPGGDIIPAYTYVSAKTGSTFEYPGKNLDTIIGGSTGAAILANGCVVPDEESPTPTPTETPSETPSETPPPTTVPPTTEPPTTTPPTSDVAPPKDCLGNDKPARCFSEGPKPSGDLAFTGMSAGWAIAAGLTLLGAGGTGLIIARRKSAGL